MTVRSSLRTTIALASLAICIVAMNAIAYATSAPVVLPTGATITPDAAPGSVFQPLTVDLPDFPGRAVDGAQTTAISPEAADVARGATVLQCANGRESRDRPIPL